MGDLAVGKPAVELPVYRAPRARRQRPLVGLSGLLLFACMFLPAVRGCAAPVTPLEMPPFLPPYLYGGVIAVIALWPGVHGVRLGGIALRALSAIVVIGSGIVAVLVPPIGMVELILGGVLLAVVGVFETTERRVAATGMAVGAICILWFGLWTTTPDALIGVQLSLISSIGLFAGSFAWLRELVCHPPIDMPRAATFVRQWQ